MIHAEESLPGQMRKRGTPKFTLSHDPRKLHQLPHPVIPQDDVPVDDGDRRLMHRLCADAEAVYLSGYLTKFVPRCHYPSKTEC